MQKSKTNSTGARVGKILPAPSTLELIKKAQTIEDLLKIKGYTLEYTNERISDFDVFDGVVVEELNFPQNPDNFLKVEVKSTSNGKANCNLSLGEQASCCANAVAVELYEGTGNGSKTAVAYLLKAAQFISIQAGYTNLSLTDLDNTPFIEVGKSLGWRVIDTYRNHRTGSELIDLRITF